VDAGKKAAGLGAVDFFSGRFFVLLFGAERETGVCSSESESYEEVPGDLAVLLEGRAALVSSRTRSILTYQTSCTVQEAVRVRLQTSQLVRARLHSQRR
jgi:hypothetical protein